MIKRIHLFFILFAMTAVIFLFLTSLFSSPGIDDKLTPAQTLFQSDREYIDFLKNRVSFRDISLHFITVRQGDNFWKIAKQFGVNIDTLIGTNPHWNCLTARVDQEIVVPNERGVLHFIKDFRELEGIAKTYGVRTDDIIVQELPPFYRVYHRLFKPESPIAVFIKNIKPATCFMTSELAQEFKVREMFRSPLGGRFSSYFGRRNHPIFRVWGFHNGIDIAACYSTPVGATRAGVVSCTGWMGGYGKTVMITHDNGYRSLYGHLSSIAVRPGQSVKPGQFVGRVGSTGWSTGPHLHFTLWQNERLINPLKVLW